jgi:hypothetical protein
MRSVGFDDLFEMLYLTHGPFAALPPDARKGYAFPEGVIFLGYARNPRGVAPNRIGRYRKVIDLPHIGRQSLEASSY